MTCSKIDVSLLLAISVFLIWTAVIGVAGLPSSSVAAPADSRDIFTGMADEVAAKMLASPAFQAKTGSGRKARIVIGDVTNNSDDEGIRVDDIFNEIRNQIVGAGTARLFAPGELNVDFIIAPELTSIMRPDEHGRRRRCFTLQLTLTTVSGEFVGAHSESRCS